MKNVLVYIAPFRKYLLLLLSMGILLSFAGYWYFSTQNTQTETPGSQITLKEHTFDECLDTADIALKVTCWTEFLEYTMHTQGMLRTFEIFTEVYRADPDFVAQGCHGAVHVLGEIAYDIYRDNGDIRFSEETSACGYGFYHGFLGKLLQERPDIEEAVAFCESLKSSPDNDNERIFTTCFHGIGHGMVEETPLPEYYWGNTQRLLVPALKTCGTLPEPYQQRECADGAFNGLSQFMIRNQYEFSYNSEDPLAWCDQFKENRINFTSCNFETAQSFAATVIEDDVKEIIPFLEGLDTEIQLMVLDIAVGGLMQEDVIKEDNSDYFVQCRVFETPQMRRACLNGAVGGLLEHGEPGNEAEKPIAFCASPIATQDEKIVCEELLASYLSAR